MQFADVNGVTLRYRVTGDPTGPAVFLANSLGTDLTIWDEVIARLPSGYRLIGFDKRGHGLSGLSSEPVTVDILARDLLGLADHLGIDQFAICGISVGGMIAQQVAEIAPERVRGLVLFDTGAQIGPVAMWEDRIAAVDADGLEPIADGVMDRWFSPDFQSTQPAIVQGYRAMLSRTPAEGYMSVCAALRDADLRASSSQIRAPSLCIVGENDAVTTPEMMRNLCGMIEGATYLEIEGCRHIPTVENPDACAEAITMFLAKLEQAEHPSRSTSFERGMTVRRKVLGDTHVDRASRQATDFDQRFQLFITEGAWGSVWSGRHFTLRDRSIVTLALLAALGHEEEFAMHVRATANTGASAGDISELLMHVAVYAGVPKANQAIKITKEILSEQGRGS